MGFFVTRPVFAAVIALIITLLGVLTVRQLAVEQYPNVAPPQVKITAIYPGASPEILVRQEHTPEGDKVTIRPLAGTRPRGATPEQDKALEAELQADPKERAEHVMLIDLARNDIGRIA